MARKHNNGFYYLLKMVMLSAVILFINSNLLSAHDDIEVKGNIEQIGAGYLVVQSTKFIVNSGTELKGRHGTTFEFSSLKENDFVEVRGNVLNDSSYLATRIRLEDEHGNEFEIEGLIEEIGDNNFKVSGFIFYVTANTEMRGRHNSTFSFSDLSTGNRVEVKGFKNSDDTFTATRIKLDDRHQDNELEITGIISKLGSNSFKVGDMMFFVDSTTAILRRSNILLSFSDLTVQMRVEVKAIKRSDGSLLATRVKIEDNFHFEDEIEFTAQIEDINGSSITVSGLTFKTDSNTVVLDNNRLPISFSSLQIGMLVEIKGFKQADGSILAVKIKIEDFFRDEVELKGKIEDLGNGFITVAGKVFTVNDQTLVLDHNQNPISFSLLTVGLIVEIKGRKTVSGDFTATKIKIEDEEDVKIFGTITALFNDRLEVAGNLIFVNENTIVLNHQAQAINYSELRVGMMVEVKMIKNVDGSFTAVRIKIEDSPSFSRISGNVSNLSPNEILISGQIFTFNSSSILINLDFTPVDFSTLNAGSEVIVWADQKSTGENQVLQMQLIKNSITGVKDSPKLENRFILEQNYPNPFNPTTIISFTIPEAQFVNLKIYNAIGQEIKNLVSRNLPAGVHRVSFDGQGLASGIYFYRLEAGNVLKIKKMILLR